MSASNTEKLASLLDSCGIPWLTFDGFQSAHVRHEGCQYFVGIGHLCTKCGKVISYRRVFDEWVLRTYTGVVMAEPPKWDKKKEFYYSLGGKQHHILIKDVPKIFRKLLGLK